MAKPRRAPAAPKIPERNVDFPEKAMGLFRPAPYKVMYGGRGGGKSWSFVRAGLVLGTRRKLSILAAREYQKSISDSVHKLVCEQIQALGLQDFYRTTNSKVFGINGTEWTYAGVRTNTRSIKSMEAIDIAMMFEAVHASKSTWDILLPTVRRDPPHGPFGEGSEVWTEFNPELATDYTYKYWVGDPPTGTWAEEINYWDNPFFPERLMSQATDLKRRDYQDFLHIFGGKTVQILPGAIYAKEILKAVAEGRVSPHVKPLREYPSIVTFDLGSADMCCLTAWQQIGTDHHCYMSYGNVGFDMGHYIDYIQDVSKPKYDGPDKMLPPTEIWLPHDGSTRTIATHKTPYHQVKKAFPNAKVRTVRRIPNIAIGINYQRSLFPRMSINEIGAADYLNGLRHYQYGVDDDGNRTRVPKHNWASHWADSGRTYAEGLKDDTNAAEEAPVVKAVALPQGPVGQRWMG
jgi:phage terminase large subunit